MAKLNGHKAGLVVGLFVAILHALWAIAVALGLGQTFMDWVLPLHFIDVLYGVTNFNFLTAVLLVVFAFAGGYIASWLFVVLWNTVKVK